MKAFLLCLLILLFPVLSSAESCSIAPEAPDLSGITNILKRFKLSSRYCKATTECLGRGKGCKHALSFLNNVESALETWGASRCHLSSEELAVIGFYIGSGYSCLNSNLRKAQVPPTSVYLKELLNKALSKLPNYVGFVLRGADLPQNVRELHIPGNVVTYAGFTSASTARGFQSTDRFIIYSQTGKPIMGFSPLQENEVLFKAGTNFKVLEKFQKGLTHYYVLLELDSKKPDTGQVSFNPEQLEKIKASATGNDPSDFWKCAPEVVETEVKQKTLPK